MFRITASTRAGLIAVVCVAVAAPQAFAKPPVKGGKAKVVKVQSVKKVAASSDDSTVLRAALSTAYVKGCENGTLPDRMMGGDNNNYEYFGDVCSVSVPTASSQVVRAAGEQTTAPSTAGPAATDNTNYEYYGNAGG